MKRFIPFIVFVVLAVFFYVGLSLNPREVPSPLIGKPAPAFEQPQLFEPAKTFAPKDMQGQVWLFNVWASWCVACREEHPYLVELAQAKRLPIVGLNYKDQPDAAKGWLAQLGNPYTLSVVDPEGKIGIDYGVYGVPETYLIDRTGLIRYKHVGPVTQEAWQEKFEPLLKELGV
ncbi:MAG: DsbE family thiol:disulfide interchange protein [Hydrogenophilaceae bacterium]|nr:DsbE family thiol:disulfide interchange protein [Hydrogenophilaceae bacterium]